MYKLIGVIGGSKVDCETYSDAENIGSMLASFNLPVICGGGGGVMEAVSKGVKGRGGTTIGILPYGRESANPYIDIAIPTGIGFARNALLVNSSDVIVAIDGEWGTLSEIGFAMQFNKPLIAFRCRHAERLGIRIAESIEDIREFVKGNL